MIRRRVVAALAASLSLGLALSACTSATGSEEYPTKDIRLIIQANPGGGSDLSSRALASELEQV